MVCHDCRALANARKDLDTLVRYRLKELSENPEVAAPASRLNQFRDSHEIARVKTGRAGVCAVLTISSKLCTTQVSGLMEILLRDDFIQHTAHVREGGRAQWAKAEWLSAWRAEATSLADAKWPAEEAWRLELKRTFAWNFFIAGSSPPEETGQMVKMLPFD
jgi:hypothetical protein